MTYINPFTNLSKLDDAHFIAGTEYTFDYTVYDSEGSTIDLTGSSFSWKLAWQGQPDTAVLTKSGSLTSGSTFQIVLDAVDTIGLEGKYIQQPIITDTESYVYRPAQGIVTILTGSS